MKTASDRLGVLLLAGVVFLLIGLGITGAIVESSRPQLDTTTYCPIGHDASAEAIVLIDLTDPIPPALWAEVLDWFREPEVSGIRDGERLTVWALSGTPSGALQRQFCRCRPARTVNPLVANRAMAAALSDSIFDKPLLSVVANMPTNTSAAATPLLESIHEVCSQPEFAPRGVRRRLVLVSNLEQNSPVLSLYRHRADVESVRRAGHLTKWGPNLKGVEVDILYIPHGRAAVEPGSGLQDFWRTYFQSCGAASVQIRRL